MKPDEISLLTGKQIEIPPKRLKWIIKKWCKKGWIDADGNFTVKGKKIRDLVLKSYYKWGDAFDGQVVIVHFKDGFPSIIGIFEDHGDNGYYLFTRPDIKKTQNPTYYLSRNWVAFIELHPNPANIWRKMNYLFWKVHGISDRFHNKVTELNKRGYKIFGKVGECLPNCQCRRLK